MYLKDVLKATGLTRKAVEYYQEKAFEKIISFVY